MSVDNSREGILKRFREQIARGEPIIGGGAGCSGKWINACVAISFHASTVSGDATDGFLKVDF